MATIDDAALEKAAEALRKMYHGSDPDEPFHIMAKTAITAYLDAQSLRSQAGVSEAVAWIRADDLQEPVERRHVTASSKVATSWAEGFHPCLPLYLRPAHIEITEVERLRDALKTISLDTTWTGFGLKPTAGAIHARAALQGETK